MAIIIEEEYAGYLITLKPVESYEVLIFRPDGSEIDEGTHSDVGSESHLFQAMRQIVEEHIRQGNDTKPVEAPEWLRRRLEAAGMIFDNEG